MNNVKIVARILFYLTRLVSVVYLVIFGYATCCLLTSWSLNIFDNGQRFSIFYPFTTQDFLLGSYNLPYIIFEFLSLLLFIGLFFVLLSNVLRQFFRPKLFTQEGIKHLQRFYIGNMTVPILLLIVASFYVHIESVAVFFVFIHFILGIFAYFLAAIFQQGVKLQNEQDLII